MLNMIKKIGFGKGYSTNHAIVQLSDQISQVSQFVCFRNFHRPEEGV